MRLGLFDGDRPCMLHGDRALDLLRVEPEASADLLAMLADKEILRRLSLLARGQPPQDARRHLDNITWAAPVQPKKVVLRGGANEEFAPGAVVGHGARIPKGTWHTGVAAIVGPKNKPAGFTVFHRVEDTIALGPWMVTDVDPLGMLFSAFADDLPCIRPVKALLDWEGEIKAAGVEAGDIVCLAAPATVPDGEDLRASLAADGQVLCRLEVQQH